MKIIISNTKGYISLTADVWSCRIVRGCLGITAHWIDEYWTLQKIFLDVPRFMTPQTGDATCCLMFHILHSWGLMEMVNARRTDNASDICAGVSKLCDRLNESSSLHRHPHSFHVRCLAHVSNLTVRDYLQFVHTNV